MGKVVTFVLRKKKTYRRAVKLFVKDPQGNLSERSIMFTTEHLVDKDQRATSARQVQAQYSTGNETLKKAMFADTGYGPTFYAKGDEELKLKQTSQKVEPEEFDKMALANLFEDAGLKFDVNKPVGVLKQEYVIHMQSITGAKTVAPSGPVEIPADKVDVQETITSAAEAARKQYEEKYGKPVPSIVTTDLAFLDGLSNPDFNPEEYITAKVEGANQPPSGPEKTKEELLDEYFVKFNKHVPNMYKNNTGWIKAKLEE